MKRDHPKYPNREQRLRAYYDHLAKLIYERLLAKEPTLCIGKDEVYSPPYYRRIDCDGNALLYFRPRPRKRWLRIELTSLWEVPTTTTLAVRTSTGVALLVDRADEVQEAVDFILDTIAYTRKVRNDWVRPYLRGQKKTLLGARVVVLERKDKTPRGNDGKPKRGSGIVIGEKPKNRYDKDDELQDKAKDDPDGSSNA